ncbi:MAG: T9SS type A sorting domain-containing protein, partial [Saprospiraceae bacterium]|nr:T9SS type A sorting domain-containing protein [Saprospiraceae bacterium]
DTDLPLGSLWPKSAVGGPDGNSIHAVAIATPTGGSTNGVVYEGVDGHLLYYRSLDAGATWDKIDVIIPGIDSTEYAFLSADDYSIDAKGNTIAVLVMNPWGDIKVAKSTDNGDTWEILTVYDFPLGPAYDLDGYDVDSIPPDTLTQEGNAIKSTDGAGSIIIDDNGGVHVFYAEMWVGDDAFTDRTWSIYPGLNSINYWNESMNDEGGVSVAGVLDDDGNGTFDVPSINALGSYGAGFASYPTSGLDANGNMYLAYSAVSELYFNENANPDLQHYRHIYLTRSTDGGQTWSDPYDIINPEYSEPDFYSFIEGVFPSMAKVVDDFVHIVYQQDFEPGHSVSGDEDDIAENFIVYTAIPVYELTGTKNVVKPSDIGFRAYPNPAYNELNFQLATEISGDVEINVFNATGQLLKTQQQGNVAAGFLNWNMDVSQLPKGLYIARVTIGNTYSSLKFYKD